ncbi:MAG: 23S rRNA (guanosine(2251)-2'-O)-methyltransferase RlmB [Deltaproteobacteria bacterium]|nr:23S rRNA (guanosine(2251)-2'-O)-methyltransferase RlmB [Deltaproteobacteria bacterium]
MKPKAIEISSLSAIDHILSKRPKRIKQLTLSDLSGIVATRLRMIIEKAQRCGVPIRQGGPKSPDPLVATMEAFEFSDARTIEQDLDLVQSALMVALDHIQDPQNFGAICRTADAFGASAILLPKDRSVTIGPGVYSASVGTVETLPICLVGNLGEKLRRLKEKGFWIVGTTLDSDASPPWKMPTFEKIVLVLGAELEGLSPLIDQLCDWKITIPINGTVQSLNVSHAAAILLYEWTRRRLVT